MNKPAAVTLDAATAKLVADNLEGFVLYYNALENECSTLAGKGHARAMSTAVKQYAADLRAAAAAPAVRQI